MKTNKKSFLTSIPAWVLSLLTAFITLILIFFMASFFGSVDFLNNNTGEIIVYLIYGILIASASYFICWRNPKSYWYVPILCNIPGIISALVEPSFWITHMWMLFSAVWVLSIAGAALGTIIGRRRK
jgi:hypothetical protein